MEGDCCFGLLVDALDASPFFVQKNVSLLNAWRKRDGRVVDDKQLVTSTTSALRDALLTAWLCRLTAVLELIKLTALPLLSDKTTELRRFLLLAAPSCTLKKVLASDDSVLRRISVLVFNESVDHMLVRLLTFFRNGFGERSVKELQCQLIVEDASGKYGLTVFLLSLVCEALDPRLKMALQLGESILNAVETDSSLLLVVVARCRALTAHFRHEKLICFQITLCARSLVLLRRFLASLMPFRWRQQRGILTQESCDSTMHYCHALRFFFRKKKLALFFFLFFLDCLRLSCRKSA